MAEQAPLGGLDQRAQVMLDIDWVVVLRQSEPLTEPSDMGVNGEAWQRKGIP